MALISMDGFDTYGSTFDYTLIEGRYGDSNLASKLTTEAGRFGGNSVHINWDNSSYFGNKNMGITNDTIIGSFAFKRSSSVGGSSAVIFRLYDGSSTVGINLRLNSSGYWQLYRGNSLLETDIVASVALDVWYWIELKVKCHDTAGTYELRVDTVTRMSATSVDTKAGSNAWHDGYRFFGGLAGGWSHYHLDDFFLMDGSGSFNNDFLGNQRIVALRPDSAGDSTDWTPNTGANYAAVDETDPDGDTTYVESGTPADKDLYDFDDISGMTDDIRGVQSVIICRETDTETFSIYMPMKSTTENQGSSQVIGTQSYVSRLRVMEENPVTTNQWTIAEVNAAQFGIELL